MHSLAILSPWVALACFIVAALAAALALKVSASARASLSCDAAGRMHAVDSLRGLAATGVLIHHIAVTWLFLERGRWVGPPSRLFEHLGESSVALFFMVTGLLFWDKVIAGKTTDWFRFLILRVYRLYPAYLTVVALLVVLAFVNTGGKQQQPVGELLRALASWLVFSVDGFQNINGQDSGRMFAYVSWSLRYEWLFYLALPLAALAWQRSWQPRTLLFFVLALATYVWVATQRQTFDTDVLIHFGGGIVAAHWRRHPRLAAWGKSPLAALAGLAALAFVVRYLATAHGWPGTLALGIFFITIASGNTYGGLLRWPPLLWLGEISYSLYLLHPVVLWLLFQKLGVGTGDVATYIVASLVATALLVFVCSAMFLRVERPFIEAGRRMHGRPRAVARSVEAQS